LVNRSFPLSTPIFPSRYLSTIAPYSCFIYHRHFTSLAIGIVFFNNALKNHSPLNHKPRTTVNCKNDTTEVSQNI
jgi:hypothetical protein